MATPPNRSHAPSAPLYPSLCPSELASDNLFPSAAGKDSGDGGPSPAEETCITLSGAVLHLIDRRGSVLLARGELRIFVLRSGINALAAFARVDGAGAVQWPLTSDSASVRLGPTHYFFTLPPRDAEQAGTALSYGLTFEVKNDEKSLKKFEKLLESYTNFSVREVTTDGGGKAVDDLGEKGDDQEAKAAAYWTTLAPNVEEYNGSVAKVIAMGSGQLVKGILWCGDVTVDRLRWGNEYLKQRMAKGPSDAEVSPEMMKRIQRAKSVTRMSERVANGILCGVVKVSGYFTSSLANSALGKKVLNLLPGEIVLATLDGFGKICDAVEVAGKNVMSTSSTVTTELVSHRYGNKAGEATSEGLDAAGHAVGTAWAVFKIRKAIDPKAAFKPTTVAKSSIKAAADDLRAKQTK